jgi:subtilisin-like proprotein convertase family protein
MQTYVHRSAVSHRIEILECRIAPAGFIFAAAGGTVAVFADSDANGTYDLMTDSFTPFGAYTGGISVAGVDLDGDGNTELVTAKAGGNGMIKIWSVTSGGVVGGLLEKFTPFTSPIKGSNVTGGDVYNDGIDELIVGAGRGGQPIVKVYSDTDHDGLVADNQTDSFVVFAPSFKGGVKVAAGNTNNSAGEELIAATWSLAGKIRIFTDSDSDRAYSDNLPSGQLEEFTPFGAAYVGGLNVASGSISGAGNNGAEVVVGRATAKPKVRIYSDANNNGLVSDDPLFDELKPDPATSGLGANVAAGDTDNSGSLVEVITAQAAGTGGKVKIFDDTADAGVLLSDNATTDDFAAFAASFSGGITLGFGKVTSATFAYTGFPQTIPDASTVTSSIFVPASAGKITDLDISLAIAHSFDGDLDITLTHVASGTSVVLFQDVGGSNEGFFIRLSDEAGPDISTASNPKVDGAISGTFNPGGAALLSAFDGLDASGEWRLTIVDDSGGDTGTLFGWTLQITV